MSGMHNDYQDSGGYLPDSSEKPSHGAEERTIELPSDIKAVRICVEVFGGDVSQPSTLWLVVTPGESFDVTAEERKVTIRRH